MTSRHPYFCGHPHCCGHPPAWRESRMQCGGGGGHWVGSCLTCFQGGCRGGCHWVDKRWGGGFQQVVGGRWGCTQLVLKADHPPPNSGVVPPLVRVFWNFGAFFFEFLELFQKKFSKIPKNPRGNFFWEIQKKTRSHPHGPVMGHSWCGAPRLSPTGHTSCLAEGPGTVAPIRCCRASLGRRPARAPTNEGWRWARRPPAQQPGEELHLHCDGPPSEGGLRDPWARDQPR